MRASKTNLQKLCGEYQMRRGELKMMRFNIVKMANELGLGEHIDIQMEW